MARFWGAGEPLFVSSLGPMPSALIRNITFESINAVSENGALFSSLPLDQPPAVEGLSLLDVSITIQRTGNVTVFEDAGYTACYTCRRRPDQAPAMAGLVVSSLLSKLGSRLSL